MTVHVERDQDTLRIQNREIKLSVNVATLEMELRSQSGASRLWGLRPRAVTEEGPLLASEPILDGHGTIRTHFGVATRIHIEARMSSRVWAQLDLDLGEDWTGVIVGFELSNRGFKPVRMSSIEPIWWNAAHAEGGVRLEHPAGTTEILEMGFHTDSPTRWRKLGAPAWRSPFTRTRSEDRGPFTPPASGGVHVSDAVTILRHRGSEGIVCGFISHRRFLSFVMARAEGGTLLELSASCFAEAIELLPRTRLRGERLWIGLDTPDQEGLASWATQAGREMDAPEAGRSLIGSIAPVRPLDAASLDEALQRAQALGLGGGAFEIGPEYAPAFGDWQTSTVAFPAGLARLAREIRDAGFKPRLCLAPFLLSPDSMLVAREPGWILRDAEGEPVRYRGPLARARADTCVLDASCEGVTEWLRKLGDALRDLGFEELSLCCLDAGLLPGARARPDLGSVEIYREALRALRGPDPEGAPCRLTGLRAPIGPSIGLIDTVRCGPQWGPRWSPRLAARGSDSTSAAEVAVRNALLRAPLHQRLWIHELGPLVLSDAASDLDPWERVTLVALVAASGGPAAIGDAPHALEPDWIDLLAKLRPASGRAAEALPTRPGEGLIVRLPDGSALLLQINFTGRERSLEIDLSQLNVPLPCHAWDILEQRFLAVRGGRLTLEGVPGHGCVWIRLSPIDERPRVVGSTLHLCGGAVETARIRALPNGALAVRLSLPGRRQGNVWLADASHAPLATCVSFEGHLEFAVSEAQSELEALLPVPQDASNGGAQEPELGHPDPDHTGGGST